MQDPDDFIAKMKDKYLQKTSVDVSYIEEQIALRAEAKKEKDFQKADAIRAELDKKGIILSDTRDGVVWDFKALYSA